MLKTDNAVLETLYRAGIPAMISGGVVINALETGDALVLVTISAGSAPGESVVRVVIDIGAVVVLAVGAILAGIYARYIV